MFKNICILCQFFGWRADYKKNKNILSSKSHFNSYKNLIMLLYFTKIYKKLRKNDENDVFFMFYRFFT